MPKSAEAKRAELEKRAAGVLARVTIADILTMFEETTIRAKKGEDVYKVRGWIMDELERRDADRFFAWVESSDESPRSFFCR